MKFSSTIYGRLKSRLRTRYQKDIQLVFKKNKANSSSLITPWLQEHKSEIKNYSTFNWFFLKQIKTYLKLKELQPHLSAGDDFGEKEDTVFEIWNQSEFAEEFLKSLNKGLSISKATQKTLQSLDKHLVILGERQLLHSNKVNPSYRPQNSLGEITHHKKVSRLLKTTMHLDGLDLDLMTPTFKEMKDFSHKIEIALKVIRKHSPSSWERFKNFTQLIIPIKQMELVSYSHQELPGVSMINLYDRDFVDLMDDLLHENGHHHLNYYLNLGKLIDEPKENIYYSPWRQTLRPLRGIYHAYFTFFWAFKLFSDIANAKEIDSIFYLFNESQKEKIYWRAVEEFWMLDYSYNDLVWAKRQGLINETGWDLVNEQRKELLKFKKKIPLWEKKLKAHKSELKNLKATLKRAKNEFKIS